MIALHRLQTICKLPLSRRTLDVFNLFSGCPYLQRPPSRRIWGLPCLPFPTPACPVFPHPFRDLLPFFRAHRFPAAVFRPAFAGRLEPFQRSNGLPVLFDFGT